MAEQLASQQPQESTTSTTTTVTIDSTDSPIQNVPTVHLKLRKPRTGRKVQWTTETVDNEDMDKKKSKCCCIYKKPKAFDESSSEDSSDDECDSCKGHVEKKKGNMHHTHEADASCTAVTEDIPTDPNGEPSVDGDPIEPTNVGP